MKRTHKALCLSVLSLFCTQAGYSSDADISASTIGTTASVAFSTSVDAVVDGIVAHKEERDAINNGKVTPRIEKLAATEGMSSEVALLLLKARVEVYEENENH